MDPVSRTDRIVAMLRQRLQERVRAAGARGDQKRETAEQTRTGLGNVQALANIDGVDDRQLSRALIQGILADQLGSNLLNEAKFQLVVDQVTEAIEGEPGSAVLLSRLVHDLRQASA